MAGTAPLRLACPDTLPLPLCPAPQFYEKWVRQQVLPKALNAKPYQDMMPQAALVHFHGPKPHDYLRQGSRGGQRQ